MSVECFCLTKRHGRRLALDDVSLEKSFDLYNKGMNLLKECGKSIDEVEKKVLVLDEDGSTHEF